VGLIDQMVALGAASGKFNDFNSARVADDLVLLLQQYFSQLL
jgi:hypothetical protein